MNKFLNLAVIVVLIVVSYYFGVIPVHAQANAYVTVVNPVRGNDFWETQNQKPIDAIKGQIEILRDFKIPVTWLLRFDSLEDPNIINYLKSQNLSQEFGLFLEITPSWTQKAGVEYRKSEVWHLAGSIFLTGYEVEDRYKLIDTAFQNFYQKFGKYPTSVGSWWVDSNSLDYMQKKYGITTALIVADQFTTDNYQVWGQYWSSPYIPAKNNTLFPAQNLSNKIPIVITQWAGRDPVNGYGGGVNESTYSLQVNDYQDYHDLGGDYFSKLVDTLTQQKFNKINQIVVGLENSYSWSDYSDGYKAQMQVLNDKRGKNQLSLVTMEDFANVYLKTFSKTSPPQIIVSDDPLGGSNKAIWFMNPYYRAGFFYDRMGTSFRDIRPYIEGQEEQCYKKSCNILSATNYITRVLDDVATGERLLLDSGEIKDFKFEQNGEDYKLSYTNMAGASRQVIFKPRDITIDDTTRTIDLTISYAQTMSKQQRNIETEKNTGFIQSRSLDLIYQSGKFITLIIFGFFVPGFLFISRMPSSFSLKVFLSVVIGFVNLTLIAFLLGLIKADILVWAYLILCFGIFIGKGLYRDVISNLKVHLSRYLLLVVLIIIIGVFFQTLTSIKSGMLYDFGMGFWGPLGHDGIWHQALTNQLIKSVPPSNPGFSASPLTNYHYFFDLLLAQSYKLTMIPIVDLLYRFYPIFFSVFLGIGAYNLSKVLFSNRLINLLVLYFVYFTGSFGWIIEFIRERHFGGESAFWVNQPVSMNLNPPFAISLLILVAVIILIGILDSYKKGLILAAIILLLGSLVEFKVYASILLFLSLGVIFLVNFLRKKDISLLKVIIPSGLLSSAVFLPQNSQASDLLVFSPFWFIHSMVEYSDRVGWSKLSQARQAYQERGDWIKFLLAEGLGLFMFIVGNLGIRFFGLLSLLKSGFNFSSYTISYQLLIMISLFSMTIPIFFIQKGNPWNTIQFFYYGLFSMSFFAAAVIVRTYSLLPKVLGLIFIIFVLVVTPINAITTFRSGLYANPPSRISFSELEALDYLREQPEGVVLTQPFDKNKRAGANEPFKLYLYETTSYVSAFSHKISYLEDEVQQDILQEDFRKRVVASRNFFGHRDYEWSKSFLKENNIKYIYSVKDYHSDLSPDKLNLKSIFENKEVVIYQTNI